jgi:cytochrome c553
MSAMSAEVGYFAPVRTPIIYFKKVCIVKMRMLMVVLRRMALGWVAFAMGQSALAADPARGQVLWNKPGESTINMCSDCHGVTPNQNVKNVWNASGTIASQGIPSVIRGRIAIQRDMFEFASWPDTDLADLAAYINAVRYGKPIAAPTLSNEECLFNWAESQLPSVFNAPAVQVGAISSLNYRLYGAGAVVNALGHNAADSQVWVLAPGLGFAAPTPLGVSSSAGLFAASRAAGCR